MICSLKNLNLSNIFNLKFQFITLLISVSASDRYRPIWKKAISHTDQLVVQFDSSKFPSDHVTEIFLSTEHSTKMTAVCYTFAQKEFWLFNHFFLKWTWKLSFSTSFTYSLTPSTSNLVNVDVRCFMKVIYFEVKRH